jgi:nucleotide-binding universal stress UspA family protein
MKKIVVPTDFSEMAGVATDVAVAMAKKLDGEIVLVYVIEQAGSASWSVSGEADSSAGWEDRLFTLKLIESARKELAAVSEKITRTGVPVHPVLRLGDPFHGIHTVIVEMSADLVIMGSEGHSRLEEMMIGSNTEKVIRHAHCPVLAVNRKPQTEGFRNIVFATSMSPEEEAVFDVLGDLEKAYRGTTHAVWINTPLLFQPTHKTQDALERFMLNSRLKNYTVNTYSDNSIEEGVLNFAEKVNADLIVMATHGRTGFARVISGSVAEEITHHTQCPVMTVRYPSAK